MSYLYWHSQGYSASMVVKDDKEGYREIRINHEGEGNTIILPPNECRKIAAALYPPIAPLLEEFSDREIARMIEDASWQSQLERAS